MNASLVIQYVAVAVIVLVCAWIAMRKLFPKTTNRWLAAASIRFGRKRDSRVAQALSQRLQPRQATSHSCADGCATCDACGPKKPASAKSGKGQTVPLHFMPMVDKGTKDSR
ncbi:MAG TPA: DUF6587 family protein [Rhodanobacteraceae bacterium]